MTERRKNERRRWGRKVTYPFIDSEGVLVTKNRRRKIDRREVSEDEAADAALDAEDIAPLAAAAAKPEKAAKTVGPKDNNTSIDISESKVMELEDALQNENEPASNIMASIKDLESEILEATDEKSQSSARLEVISKKNSPAEKASKPENKKPAKEIAEETAKETTEDKQAKTPEEVPAEIKESSAELPEIELPEDKPVDKQVDQKAAEKVNGKVNGTANGKDKGMSIELVVKGKKHTVTLDKTTCVVGRDPACDIVINNKFVSRKHATIVLKNDKFLVEDTSFNGTYVNFNNGQKIHVAKDEQTLIANGFMSMGKPVDDDSKSVIEFKISQ